MSEQEKRNKIKKYFNKTPKWATNTIIAGVVIFFIGLLGLEIAILIGLILIAIGGTGIWMAIGGRPSDSENDKYIEEDLSKAKKISLDKSMIDESELVGETVVVTGPRFWNTGGSKILYRKGKDETLRYSPINISVLNMTENYLISYQASLDLTTGNFLNESTDEYFYNDIVSVSTKTESKSIDIEGSFFSSHKNQTVQLNAAETFILTTSGGTSIETILRDPKLIEMMGGGNIPTTQAERAIQVVRKMLREKKLSSN